MSTPFNFSLGFAQEPKFSGNASDDPRRNTTSLNWSNGSDMSAFSFTLTLLLLGTVGAIQTENPMFWLLIGPAPFFVVFAGLVFFCQRFGPRRMKNLALRPDHHAVNTRSERLTLSESTFLGEH
jgi:hypothetical protein